MANRTLSKLLQGTTAKWAIGWFVGMGVKSCMDASLILCHPQMMIWAWLQ
ncbi:hypothetical protein AYX15_06558 [Cryptococcus neoformans]|nr:hypothetical protein AYX15_06558 [Cryptococcus neoformans var. grubii]